MATNNKVVSIHEAVKITQGERGGHDTLRWIVDNEFANKKKQERLAEERRKNNERVKREYRLRSV